MRHEDAGLALWLAGDDPARDRARTCEAVATATAVAQAAGRLSIRQRAGAAVIALGERLAGEQRPVPRRRLAGQGS